MVHTIQTSAIPFGYKHSRRQKSSNLYKVVVNGEDGEYYECEVEADSYGEASTMGEEFAMENMVDIQYIEVYQVA